MKIILMVVALYLACGSSLSAQLKSPLKPVGYISAPVNIKEKIHNFFLTQRLIAATSQRDSFYLLYNLLKQIYKNDTTQRSIDFINLQAEFDDLISRYNDLDTNCNKLNQEYKNISAKFSEFLELATGKEQKLNIALQQKNKELLEREAKLLELESIISKQDSISNALKEMIRKALLDFNSQDLTVELKNGKVYISFSDEFLFKSGSPDVEAKGLEAIKKVAEVVNLNDKVDILIEGHTDNVPIKSTRFNDNWDLSAARSISIVRILNTMYKVHANRLSAAGRGEFVPRASNATTDGKAKNRRVEIILIPDLSQLYKIIYK